MKRIFTCVLLLFIVSIWADTVVRAETVTVISPKRFETLHTFPVPVVVEFGPGTKLETFKASLNDADVTHLFEKTDNGMRALVGLEQGLRVRTGEDLLRTPNMLRIRVQGSEPDPDIDFETYFFLDVDQLVTIGPGGGVIESLDGRLVVDIPERTLSSRTIVAVAEVLGSGSIGSAYQLSPAGLRLDQPVRVTMKYTPEELSTDIVEDDLFLISENGVPRNLDQGAVDKTSRTVSGTVTSLAKLFMSYTRTMGKKLTDLPPATDFRLPIGDVSAARYTCGRGYEPPRDVDLGETLNLLRWSSAAGSDYPRLIFNEGGKDNTWEVSKAFGWNKSVDPGSGFKASADTVIEEDEEIYNNGEDWRFIGSATSQGDFPVHAVADGLVIYNGAGYGNTIVLGHKIPGGSVFSIYSHLKEKSSCYVGTAVHKGNIIGQIEGAESKGAYLHFAIGQADLLKVDAEFGELKVPGVWFEEWRQNQVREHFYEPTNFMLNIMGAYKWDFNVNGNDEGWIVKNVDGQDHEPDFQVKDGSCSIIPTSGHFQMVSYPLKVEPMYFDSVFIIMRSNAGGGSGKAYFQTDEEPVYSEKKAVSFDIQHDGEFHEYRVYMADHPQWKGNIVGIRLDFLDMVTGETTKIDFDQIRLGRAYLSRIPDTGQGGCYDDSGEIACPSPNHPFYGQDAQYAINPPGYEVKTINGHEVIVDRVTGLIWQTQDDGTKRTWREALEYCENLDLAGYSDWRLPTKKELQSIENFTEAAGSTEDTADFPYSYRPDACYWSASTRAFVALSAWTVCLWNSEINFDIKTESHYVRAVLGRPLQFGDFRDNGDGTVTDITTDLMWQQGEAQPMAWEDALTYCENLDRGGFNDWRLPNIRELLSLVDDFRRDPAIDTAYFPGCRPSMYWSSTTYSRFPDFAWYVRFADGAVQSGGQKSRQYYVRAVRGGE